MREGRWMEDLIHGILWDGGVNAFDKVLPLPRLPHTLLPPTFYFIFLFFSLFYTSVLAINTLRFKGDVEGFISNAWVTEPTEAMLL
jgi:hypothetical protein